MNTVRLQKSRLSSLIGRPAVNDSPADDDDEEQAEERARAHKRIVRLMIRTERRIRNNLPAIGPKPIEKPKRAEAVLAALAAVYAPGALVRLADIASAVGCGSYLGSQVRHWARSVDRWPYRDGKGGSDGRPGGRA